MNNFVLYLHELNLQNGKIMKPDKIIRGVFTVTRKAYITPHLIRVYLTSEDLALFAHTTVGINNKILIPSPGTTSIHFPKLDKKKKKKSAKVKKPTVRTYTHRGIDLEQQELWIDFVAHGDEGPASAWAIKAQKGDCLGIMMKNKKKELYPKANNYLLVGDATALPVLSAILEDLPANAKGTCIIEVNSEADKLAIQTKANINFIWLYNAHPQQGSALAETVKLQELPQNHRFAYIAAEYQSVKAIRKYLKKDQAWGKKEFYAFSYWKSGSSESKSAKSRLEERAEND